jgi:D-glycero-D-manno-heptose 1,7-bisphosphate phosphatase
MSGTGAVFLDRDGVLIEHVHHLHRPSDIALIATARAAVAALNQAEIPAIVITNQSVVARGLCDEAELDAIHENVLALLRPAEIQAVYYCPHLPPEASHTPQPPYRVDCACRKPAPGLLQQAAQEHGLDLTRSLMIGDSTSDLEAGRRAGAQPALVQTGVGGRDARYAPSDHVFADVGDAVHWWIAERPR